MAIIFYGKIIFNFDNKLCDFHIGQYSIGKAHYIK